MPNCTYILLPEGPLDEGYFCTTKYTGDGAEDTFDFSWPYINQQSWSGETSTYIRCWLNGVETTEFDMPTAASVQFDSAPGNNVCIMIRRDSNPADRGLNWTPGSRHTAQAENLDSLKAFYLIQELLDQLRDTNAIFNEGEHYFNAYQWTGDGSETDFPMSETYGPNDESNITNAAEVLVLLNGAAQQTDAYTLVEVGGITNVRFDSAPATGVAVEARTMTSGIAQSTQIADASVTCAKLADGAINSDCWERIVDLDDLASEDKSVLIWDDSTGGLQLGVRTLDHDDISDFDAGVQANALSSLAVPSASVSMASQKITNLLAGTNDTDAVNKAQLDAVANDAQDTGRVIANQFTTTNTSQEFYLGWAYDQIQIFPIFADEEFGSNDYRGVVPHYDFLQGSEATGYGAHRFSPVLVADGLDGTDWERYFFRESNGTAPCILLIQRTSTGFNYYHRAFVFNNESNAVGSMSFRFVVFKNSTIA